MTSNRTLSNLALAMMVLPAILGAPLCYLRPERAWAWVIGMFVLPAAFGIKALGRAFGKTAVRATMTRAETPVDARKAISWAMIFASLALAVPLGALLAAALGIIADPSARAIGTRGMYVLVGCYFVFRGNGLPKILVPLSDIHCDPATMQNLRRLTGWAYFLAGFIFAVVWLFLPEKQAEPIGIAIIVAGILVPSVIMRSYAKRRPGHPSH